MVARAKAGKFNGGPVPYGYRLAENKQLAIDEAEAAVVRHIFDLFIEKRIVRQVRLALAESGSRTRKSFPWAAETIRRILSSRIYVGELIYNRRNTTNGKAKPRVAEEHVCAPGVAPAIVPPEVFEQAQASDYLLSGLLRCEKCGATMYGHTTWREKAKPTPETADPPLARAMKEEVARLHGRYELRRAHRYYRCFSRNRLGPNACAGNSVRANQLDRAVLDVLLDLRLKPDRLREIESLQQSKSRAEIPRRRAEVTRLEQAVARASAREERIYRLFEDGEYSKEEKDKQLAAVERERRATETNLAEARERLEQAERETVDVDRLVNALKTAYDLYETLGFEYQRTLLRALLDHIVVGPVGGKLLLKGNLGEGRFVGVSGARKVALGGLDRVPWVDVPEIRLDARNAVLVSSAPNGQPLIAATSALTSPG